MRSPFALFRFIAKSVANSLGAGVAGDFLFDVLPEIARDVWSSWSGELDQDQRVAEIQEIVQESAEEIGQQVDAAIQSAMAVESEEIRRTLAAYLAAVPASIRRSMRRPSDPSGTTVAASLLPRSADELLRFLPSKLPRFAPGDQPLNGVDWQLEQLLGVGGFGEVWKARNPYLTSAKPVALKFCLNPQTARVLRNEAAVLDSVMHQGVHSGIVSLQNTYLRAEIPCLQYEYIEGGDLVGLIREWHCGAAPFHPDQVTKIILELALIAGAAHRATRPIVHRDLKPANILVHASPDGNMTLKVTDFGIGGAAVSQSIRETTRGTSRSQFAASAVQGTFTPLYASPQQMRGDSADPCDDVFSIGVIWYQCLTGDLAGGRPGGSRWRVKLAERGFSHEFADILEACFEDNPKDRPSDGIELAKRLQGGVGSLAAAHHERGRLATESKDWSAAVAAFRDAVCLNPRRVESIRGLANAVLQSGEIDAAISSYSEIIRLEPNSAQAFDERGTAFFQNGQHDKAMVDFMEAMRLDLYLPSVHLHMGQLYRAVSDRNRSIGSFSTAIQLNERFAEAHLERGRLHSANGNSKLALADLSDAIRLDSNCTAAYLERAELYQSLEKNRRAIADYSRAIGIDPSLTNAYWQRGCLLEGSDHELAIQDFSRVIRCWPDFAEAFLHRGESYLELGEDELAFADLTRAVELDSSLQDDAGRGLSAIHRQRAYFHLGRGEYDLALEESIEATNNGMDAEWCDIVIDAFLEQSEKAAESSSRKACDCLSAAIDMLQDFNSRELSNLESECKYRLMSHVESVMYEGVQMDRDEQHFKALEALRYVVALATKLCDEERSADVVFRCAECVISRCGNLLQGGDREFALQTCETLINDLGLLVDYFGDSPTGENRQAHLLVAKANQLLGDRVQEFAWYVDAFGIGLEDTELREKCTNYYSSWGHQHYRNGEFKDAAVDYDTVLTLDPGRIVIRELKESSLKMLENRAQQ